MKNILISTGHELKYPDIIKAENCTLYDADGNTYLDLESGVWCTSVGHSHPRIIKTMTEQAEKITHTGYCYLNPIIEKTAEKICRITGIKDGKCVFLCSGSEAVEYSVKIAQSISDKPYLLTMKDSYLSAVGSANKKDEQNWILFDWKNNDDIKRIQFDKVSGFIFEPGSSSGLVHFPPLNLIKEIVEKVRANNGIIITNEVTTGIGRTGEWFGYNHYNFTPDIVVMGKGLGNGYPVSCSVISPAVLDKLDLEQFYYAQSHQNDPLGAAIANTVIDIIEENDLLKKCKDMGDEINTRLNTVKQKYGIIKEIRNRGLMIGIEFEDSDTFSYAQKVSDELLKRNIILVKRPGYEVLRIDPALTIEQKEIDLFLASMESIISEIA